MLGKDLSRVLSDIDDAKIEAAAKLAPRARNAWRYVAAMAAAVAIVVAAWLLWPEEETPGAQLGTPTEGTTVATEPSATMQKTFFAAPGILKVYACDVRTIDIEELEEYEILENEFRWCAVWKLTSNEVNMETPSFGRPITLQIPDEYFESAEVTFCISSDQEGFCKKTTLTNGEPFYLTKQVDTMAKHKIWKEASDKDFYLDIIIYADGKIAGYGIMSFYMNASNGCCYAYKCKTVCFPMVNGELQDVSEEYVLKRIEEYKQTQPEGQGAEFFRKLHDNDD